jgi:hypothetical protein
MEARGVLLEMEVLFAVFCGEEKFKLWLVFQEMGDSKLVGEPICPITDNRASMKGDLPSCMYRRRSLTSRVTMIVRVLLIYNNILIYDQFIIFIVLLLFNRK